jgi:hypothetical protein
MTIGAVTRRILRAIFLIVILVPMSARAAAAGENLSVYLLTFGPGDEAWEKFGHNAIWLRDETARDPAAGDIDYNWGVFDFGTGLSGLLDFIGRFIQGRLLYSMSGYVPGHTALDTLEYYQSVNRSVLVQKLELSGEEKLALETALAAQDRPGKREYLYDYYVNNCSTKVRDAIDQATGGQIKPQLAGIATGTTFRWHTSRLTADTLWLYTSLYYVLGHPVDRPLSAWEESFLPEKLSGHLRAVTIDGHPLISMEKRLFASTRIPERDAPPKYLAGFLVAGIVVGAAMVGCVVAMKRWRRLGFIGFVIIAIAWSLMAGLAGGISKWGILFTDHTAARYNENLMQLAPISLALVVFAPLARRWKRTAFYLAVGAAGMSGVGFVLKVTPWFWQTNGNIVALALPAHVGLVIAVGKLSGLSGSGLNFAPSKTPPEGRSLNMARGNQA